MMVVKMHTRRRHTKSSHQTAMSRLLIRVASKHSVCSSLSDQASTCTDIRRERWESVTWHITGSRSTYETKPKPASQPAARYEAAAAAVTICRGESSELNLFGM